MSGFVMSYTIQLKHKHQTKANDCWYACTQMLLTWKNGGYAKLNLNKGTHTNAYRIRCKAGADSKKFPGEKHYRWYLPSPA